jgi:CBS domain containing-hemolysin-like protein
MSDDSSTASPLPTTEEQQSPVLKLVQPIRSWIKGLRRRSDNGIRETLEELIEEVPHGDDDPQAQSERLLLTNILKLRDLKAGDVMVPRADIKAVPIDMSLHELRTMMQVDGHSRMPVYREDLDDVIGMVHIKDIVPFLGCEDKEFKLENVVRDILIVAPSMSILDLLVEMRQTRRHMALVIDEFGGIDGLITIEDLVEEIVGEIEDEHDDDATPALALRSDGTLVADGRALLEDVEAITGQLLDEESRSNVDTLGGLILYIADRVPARGELIRHDGGLEFEIMDADFRRIKRVRIRGIAQGKATSGASATGVASAS